MFDNSLLWTNGGNVNGRPVKSHNKAVITSMADPRVCDQQLGLLRNDGNR